MPIYDMVNNAKIWNTTLVFLGRGRGGGGYAVELFLEKWENSARSIAKPHFKTFFLLEHSARLEIRKAIRHWKKHTCINFHKKRSGDVDFLRFAAEDG